MKTIENLKDLNDFISTHASDDVECILRVYDNKSYVLLQTVVIKHPIIFIRGIQEFCKSVNLPVSDVSVHLVGFIDSDSKLDNISEFCEISPYVYFKKADDNDVSSES